jgi:hypothetical protein
VKYVFGQDISYTFTPYIDGDTVAAIPSQTAKLLVYNSEPSRSQVVAETGHVFGPYTKAWVANSTSVTFAVEAIDDPDISGTDYDAVYWVGIKFILESGGVEQIVIQSLPLERVKGTASALMVTEADVKEQFEPIGSYASTKEVLDQILIQQELLKVELESKGYEWAHIWRPDKLKRAVVFSTLGALLAQESTRDGDQFDKLSKRFDTNAQGFLKVISLEYDASKNNEPDSVVQAAGYTRIIR